jgi:uncharacterized protein DUF1206
LAKNGGRVTRRLGFLVRLGHAARGFVYVAMGALAGRAALFSHRSAMGPAGALRWVFRERYGSVVVAWVAGGLIAEALFRAVEAWSRSRGGFFSWIAPAGRSVAAAVFAVTAIRVGQRLRRDSDGAFLRTAAAWVLRQDWGRRALLAGGIVAGIVAVVEIARAFTGRFRDSFRKKSMGRQQRAWTGRVMRAGSAAHGALVGVMAVYLFRAGVDSNPRDIVGSGGALERIRALPFGPGLLAAVGAGLVAFGLSQWILAIYRRPE